MNKHFSLFFVKNENMLLKLYYNCVTMKQM